MIYIEKNMRDIEKNMRDIEKNMRDIEKFRCPNLSIIDQKGNKLNLKEETIERAKSLATEYFKKTYHSPHYSFIKNLFPAFIYIASVLENEKIYQRDVIKVFEISHSTINKYYRDITDTLCIDMKRDRKISYLDREKYTIYLEGINKIGKDLNLRDKTIEKAKGLAIRYFKVVPRYYYYSYDKQLLPVFVYAASIIENDRRSELDIYNKEGYNKEVYNISGVINVLINKCHNNSLRTIGMKIMDDIEIPEQFKN